MSETANLAEVATSLGISSSALISRYASGPVVDWTTPGLKIVRLRLLSDPGFPWWDVSYCWGEIEGEPVRVLLPFSQLPKRWAPALIAELNRARLNGKRLGVWDAISTLS